MDLATLIGLVGGFGIVIMAILIGGSVSLFLDMPSFLIVVVGSVFVVMIKFSLQQFLKSAKVIAKTFTYKMPATDKLIDEIVEVAQLARKDGLLALDGRASTAPLFQTGMRLMADGQSPDMVRALLEKERALIMERHRWGAKICTAIGDVAPAMGMIGTLVGLVQMLANMSDPKAIGPAMAVALLTTLYGALLANVMFIPMADKLSLRASEEARLNSMIIDAVAAIHSGTSPAVVTQILATYIPPAQRKAAKGA